MFQTKVVKKIKTHVLFSVTIFCSENLAIYEIMWKNMVETDRPRMAIWSMRFACWVTKAAERHSVFVITPVAFSRQQWVRELATTLRDTCIVCLVISYVQSAGYILGA